MNIDSGNIRHALFPIQMHFKVNSRKLNIVYDAEFCPVFSRLHYKDHVKSQYNFFGRIFVTLFFGKLFNVIGYANNTTCDITLQKALFV